MPDRREQAAELRELCASLAIQAGAKSAAQIIGLAEELRAYIQIGHEANGRPGPNGLPGSASPQLPSKRTATGQENE